MDFAAVVERNPEVILASWCGKKADTQEICSRPGWSEIAAVQRELIYEVRSSDILQPGPAALTEGVRQIHAILARALDVRIESHVMPLSLRD